MLHGKFGSYTIAETRKDINQVFRELIGLDSTLRDGGYYNAWDFSQGLIDDHLLAMKAA